MAFFLHSAMERNALHPFLCGKSIPFSTSLPSLFVRADTGYFDGYVTSPVFMAERTSSKAHHPALYLNTDEFPSPLNSWREERPLVDA